MISVCRLCSLLAHSDRRLSVDCCQFQELQLSIVTTILSSQFTFIPQRCAGAPILLRSIWAILLCCQSNSSGWTGSCIKISACELILQTAKALKEISSFQCRPSVPSLSGMLDASRQLNNAICLSFWLESKLPVLIFLTQELHWGSS